MSKQKLNEEAKKMMSLAGIKEGDNKFLTNESFAETDKATHPVVDTEKNNKDDRFIVLEFEQEEIEPGKDDDQLYNLN